MAACSREVELAEGGEGFGADEGDVAGEDEEVFREGGGRSARSRL